MVKTEKAVNKELAAKREALDASVAAIIKEHGDGAITRGHQKTVDVQVISTRTLPVDIALGVGGIPRGRMTEIFGPESSGKTTLALQVVAVAQAEGGTAAYIDTEHSLDPTYMRALGVDTDALLLSQPDNGEQALGILVTLVQSGAVDVIVVDSVAALVPKAELEGNMGEAHVGAQARLMSQACRKLMGIIKKANCAVIFINQIREKIGVMWGSPETTSGGRALKFYASCRIDIRRIGGINVSGTSKDKDKDSPKDNIGNRVKVKIVKNKVAPPFKTAEFDIIFGKGVSHEGCLLDYAETFKLVSKRGAFYYLGEEKIGNGRQQAVAWLAANKLQAGDLELKILEKTLPKFGGELESADTQTEDVVEEESEEPVASG